MGSVTEIVCLYFGRQDECPECGGLNETGTRFCSHECAANQADRIKEMDEARAARRREEDEFARSIGL